jgi:hypothetical protein
MRILRLRLLLRRAEQGQVLVVLVSRSGSRSLLEE